MIDALDRIAAAMPLVLTVVAVAAALLAITLVVRVVRKAGYSPWWAIGVFVPGVNLVLLVMFATVRWPLERRLGEAEQRLDLAPHRGGTTPEPRLDPRPDPRPVVAPPTFTPVPYPGDTRPDMGG